MATMTKNDNKTRIRDSHGGGSGLGSHQVIIHNDNHNAFMFVIEVLMKVFNHPQSIAVKITKEAHEKGKAIAEVEDEEDAMKHCLELRLSGLEADVEAI